MQAQWNAQGAQRRRRILIDDASTPEATKSKATQESAANDSDSQRDRARRSYEPLALDGQPRVTDLIPRRIWVLALFMLVWLLLISGIVFLHLQLDRWSVVVGNGGLSALDLSGFAGLATWFSSATLLLAAIGSLQVYNVRRHKTDDYRGTYRLWFWTAAWLVLASMEATACLRLLVRSTAVHFSGSELAGGGDLWWMLIFGLPSLVLGVRLAIEMRKSKAAVTFAFAAGVAYLYAAIFHLGYVPVEEHLVVLHRWAAALTAHSLVLATVAIYARRVLLDAQDIAHTTRQGEKATRQRSQKQTVSSESEQGTQEKSDGRSSSTTKKKSIKSPTVKTPAVKKKKVTSQDPPNATSSKRGKTAAKQSTPAKSVADQADDKTQKQDGNSDEQASRKQSKRQKRREQTAQSKSQSDQQQTVKKKVQASKTSAQQTTKRSAKPVKILAKSVEATPDFQEIEDEQPNFPRLSKSERRKMRKQRRNETRRAA